MQELIWILGSVIVVSLISLIGVITLAFTDKVLKKLLFLLVAFSAGAMLGGAFIHLLPEALENSSSLFVFLFVLVGFSLFFILEKLLFWRHCHEGKCHIHTFTYMNLMGDAVHNFIDGMIVAATYLVSIPLGIITTVAIIAHEIPQEISDFGVLVYGGFKKTKALFANFMVALTAVLGAVFGYLLSNYIEGFNSFLVPFAAGGFIYIAASDLVPELHKEKDIKKSSVSFIVFLLGILLMWITKIVLGG
jgi:zinc and cadmium transporter